MTTEIALIEIKNPLQVFSTPKGLDAIIDKIEAEVSTIDQDVSTKEGRDNIRSIAAKLAKSKTALDKMGKELTEEQRAIVTAVNAERSRAWDRMEALQHKVRQPLTDYENAEKTRVQEHEDALAHIVSLGIFEGDVTTVDIEARIKQFESLAPRNWQEFDVRYVYEVKTLSAALETRLAASKKADADRAELARLQAEEQARLQKEREDKIAADAADAAKKAAEEKAKAEADALAAKVAAENKRIEAEKQAALDAAAKAEEDRIAAETKAEMERLAAEGREKMAKIQAEKDAEAAVQAERARAEAAKKAEAADTAKREADKEHRKKINNEVLETLLSVLSGDNLLSAEAAAKSVITAIAQGKISHVKITY